MKIKGIATRIGQMNKIMKGAFAATITGCLLSFLVQTSHAAILTHRYSFDVDATDSVGNDNGILQGNALVTNGALVLDGSNSSVQLPANLFTNYNSASFELWFNVGALTTSDAQLYTFAGGGLAIAVYQLNGKGYYYAAGPLLTLASPPVRGTVHIVWTQDSATKTARLYVNGLLGSQNTNFNRTLAGSATKAFIGGVPSGSGLPVQSDVDFNGRILEFRTYLDALTPLQVAVADALGPDQTSLDPGLLQDIRILPPESSIGPGALIRPGVFADFAIVTNVNISTQPDLILSSDNTNVIMIAPDQRLQTMGLGMANITVSYGGISNTMALTVAMPEDVALIHRYSFNEQAGDWIVHDSAGVADGDVVGDSGYNAFTGNGELMLTAGTSGYVALPSGLISCLSEVSFEAWVTWVPSANPGWQRIFDFGNSSGSGFSSRGITYLFLTPDGANWTAHNVTDLHFVASTNSNAEETPWLDWTNILPANVTSFVAVTYSPLRGIAKMYLNGQLAAVGKASIPLSAIIDANDWLGKSQFGADPNFGGRYDEFRIYRGLLSDADVAADYAAGPNAAGVDYVLHNFVSGNSLTITWGVSATNSFLESSPFLGPDTVWTAITNVPTLKDGRYRVTVPILGDPCFFRLHAPP